MKFNEVVHIMKEPKNCKSNYWLQTMIFNKPDKNLINHFLKILTKKIFARPAWKLLHKISYLKNSQNLT